MQDPTAAHSRSESAAHILRVATRLFAERGFHGASMRDIASAAGVNIATLHYHFTSKRELYAQVVRHLYVLEYDLISRFVASVDTAALQQPSTLFPLLSDFLDRFVDFMYHHPAHPRLYMHRWLDGADDLHPIEIESSLSPYALLRDLLERAQQAGAIRADLDLSLFLRSFSWMIFSYFVAGPIDWERWRGDPYQPESYRAFKAYLREYLLRMLAA